MIKKDTIFIWTGLISAIPSGWVRETALDGYFPKGTAQGTNPNTTGGNATHNHTSSAHTHADNGHTHQVTIGDIHTYVGRGGTDFLGQHQHPTVTSGAISGGGLASVVSTYADFSNNPIYQDVIYIKPSANVSALPNNAVALCDKTDFANNTGNFKGFYKCDGQNSTPNLGDKYIRGAGTGQEAGGTGGSYTNIHDLTHTHTVTAHTHAQVTTGNNNGAVDEDIWGGSGSGGYQNSGNPHTHTVSLGSVSDVISSAVNSITTSETVEPAHTKLLPIQNRSGANAMALGVIGMWLGALPAIPKGWVLCDGTNGTVDMRSRHLKLTTTTTDVGVTGGSNTHTHTNNIHTHTSTGHSNHTVTISGHPAWNLSTGGQYYNSTIGMNPSALHDTTVGSATPTYANATTNADSANNEPLYTTVAYIKLVTMSGGGSLLAGVL